MADAYAFTGHSLTGYPDYRDTATGMMLAAEPGESYGIAAVDGAAPVPPPDGRWETAPEWSSSSVMASAPPGPEPPPEVPPVPPVPALEGSDA